jgi:hypothetical protein
VTPALRNGKSRKNDRFVLRKSADWALLSDPAVTSFDMDLDIVPETQIPPSTQDDVEDISPPPPTKLVKRPRPIVVVEKPTSSATDDAPAQHPAVSKTPSTQTREETEVAKSLAPHTPPPASSPLSLPSSPPAVKEPKDLTDAQRTRLEAYKAKNPNLAGSIPQYASTLLSKEQAYQDFIRSKRAPAAGGHTATTSRPSKRPRDEVQSRKFL